MKCKCICLLFMKPHTGILKVISAMFRPQSPPQPWSLSFFFLFIEKQLQSCDFVFFNFFLNSTPVNINNTVQWDTYMKCSTSNYQKLFPYFDLKMMKTFILLTMTLDICHQHKMMVRETQWQVLLISSLCTS